MLGTRIRQLRERQGMKQAELGAAIGRSESYISRLETGSIKKPSAESLVKLARALDVNSLELERAAGYTSIAEDDEEATIDRIMSDPLIQLAMIAIKRGTPEQQAVIRRIIKAVLRDETQPPSPEDWY